MLNKTLIITCAVAAIVRIWQLEAENSALRAKSPESPAFEIIEEFRI